MNDGGGRGLTWPCGHHFLSVPKEKTTNKGNKR
jgi:hypothetical protein